MIAPPKNWHKIQSDAERLEVYKKYKFLTSTKTELKELYYKGLYTDEPVVCEIVGYADKMLVININGELHSIHSAYLLQMQETTERLQNFISIDFETANSYYVPCALGLTIVKNGKITEKKSFLIKPWTEILQEKTNIHGITNKDVCNSDTFDVLWESIKTYFEETPYVVAHNISFDGEVLATAAKHYQIQLPKLMFYCTKELSISNYASLKSSGAISGYGLDVLCKYFNIPLQHHNCGSDSYAAAQIMLNLLSNKDSKIETYNKPISPYSPDKKKKKKTHVQEPIDYVEPNIKYDSCDIIFQGKTFVITGTVSLDQTDKAYYKNLIEQLGGDFKDSVSRKTDYLIVGLQDPKVVKDKVSWKTTSIIKAEEYKENGIPISIISRQDFLKSLFLALEDVIL